MESAAVLADMASTATATTAMAMVHTGTATAHTAQKRKTNNNGFSPIGPHWGLHSIITKEYCHKNWEKDGRIYTDINTMYPCAAL